MNKQGPTNIDLLAIKSYKFPITAISSIIHRITGVVMVVMMPFMIWALSQSLSGINGFTSVKKLLTHSGISFFSWVLLVCISYHIIAGIRHLMMDIGFGESMKVAKITSIFVLISSAIIAILWGVWLWAI